MLRSQVQDLQHAPSTAAHAVLSLLQRQLVDAWAAQPAWGELPRPTPAAAGKPVAAQQQQQQQLEQEEQEQPGGQQGGGQQGARQYNASPEPLTHHSGQPACLGQPAGKAPSIVQAGPALAPGPSSPCTILDSPGMPPSETGQQLAGATPDRDMAGSRAMQALQAPSEGSAGQPLTWQDAEAAIDQLIAEAERAASVTGGEGPSCGGSDGCRSLHSCDSGHEDQRSSQLEPLSPQQRHEQQEQQQQQHEQQSTAADAVQADASHGGCTLLPSRIFTAEPAWEEEGGCDSEDEELERKYGLRPPFRSRGTTAGEWQLASART